MVWPSRRWLHCMLTQEGCRDAHVRDYQVILNIMHVNIGMVLKPQWQREA